MIKRYLLTLLAVMAGFYAQAQTTPPDAFVYQGLAKHPSTGGIASNTNIRLKVQVLKGGPKGPMVFEENHQTTTNADGIFSVLVGRGQRLAGSTYTSLYDIPWSQDSFYFSLSMAIAMKFPVNRYSPYIPIGTQQFFSVPYAMFAKEAQHVLDSLSIQSGGNYRYLQLGNQTPVAFWVGDGDTSALNELQTLVRLGGRMGLKTTAGEIIYSVNLPDSSSTNELQSISQTGNIITLSQGGGSVTIVDNDKQTLALVGQNLSIAGGNTVTLPDKDQQTLSLSGNTVSITGGNSITLNPNDADADPKNELQTISKSGSTITLSQSGGSVTDSDNQNLSVSGSTLSISSGNSVTLPDGSSTNELQTLGQTSNKGTITLSQGGGLVTLPDSSASNELQTISKTGSTITLSQSGGSVTDSDNQNLSVSGSTLSISSGNSVTLPDGSSTNELQTLGQTSGKGTITLSQGGGKVTLPDSSSTNELQTISKSGSTITLSNSGGSVTDSDAQTLSLSGNSLSISGGNSVTINPNDADSDSTNEFQTLSISGNTISLSDNGGSVTVPDKDEQTLTLSGNTLSISGGNSVTLSSPDADSTNEIQVLSKTGNKIQLSKGGGEVVDQDSQAISYSKGVVTLERGGSINLPDTSSINELQTLSLSGDTLKISKGNSVVLKSNGTQSQQQLIKYVQLTDTMYGGITAKQYGAGTGIDSFYIDTLQDIVANQRIEIRVLASTSASSTTVRYKVVDSNGLPILLQSDASLGFQTASTASSSTTDIETFYIIPKSSSPLFIVGWTVNLSGTSFVSIKYIVHQKKLGTTSTSGTSNDLIFTVDGF